MGARKLWLVGAGVLVVALVIGGVLAVMHSGSGSSNASSGDGGHTLTGVVHLNDALSAATEASDWTAGSPCPHGFGPLSDVKTGAPVVIKDAAGKLVGSTTLDAGVQTGSYDEDRGRCDFKFNVDVSSSSFYQIQVADQKAVTFSDKQLNSDNWSITILLADH